MIFSITYKYIRKLTEIRVENESHMTAAYMRCIKYVDEKAIF